MNDKILQLRKQIEVEETKIRNCKHDFGDSYFDPETVMEGYGSVQDGAGSDPTPANTNASVEVDITTGMTAVQIAAAVTTALNNTIFPDFVAVQQPNPNDFKVQVTNDSAGVTASASDFNVGSPFAVVVNQAGTGVGNTFINDGDSLTLAIKKLDDAIGSFLAQADSPTYDETVDIVASGATPPSSLNGPISASTNITLPNNSREGNVAQKYTVGRGTLELFLNGVYLRLGAACDWLEVGATGTLSNQIEILIPLVVGDVLHFRITEGGGGANFGGPPGPPGPVGPTGPAGSDAVGGPIHISTKTSNYTAGVSDNVLKADCTGGNITFSLPAAASATGRVYYFKKIDATGNSMTIQANGSELIDGLNTQSTSTQWESFTLVTDGATWSIL